MKIILSLLCLLSIIGQPAHAQEVASQQARRGNPQQGKLQQSELQQGELQRDNITWTSPSKNAGESMPCGGGDIGLNVWVENGDLLLYVARSGAYDENNTLLKLGRIRIRLNPNPFTGDHFSQTLDLHSGAIYITAGDGSDNSDNSDGSNDRNRSSLSNDRNRSNRNSRNSRGNRTRIKLWVDVFKPVVHVELENGRPMEITASYENWRYHPRITTGVENNQNSYKFSPRGEIRTRPDSVSFQGQDVEFYHHNDNAASVMNVTVHQQDLDSLRPQLYDPLYNLISGGTLEGKDMLPDDSYTGVYLKTDFKGWRLKSRKPVKKQELRLILHIMPAADASAWRAGLDSIRRSIRPGDEKKSLEWWSAFWDRSFIHIASAPATTTNSTTPASSPAWESGRNYQLFRYMLACNAFGNFPTKFNGGLFTVDPVCTDTAYPYTPDFRNWGGGTFTAQNQRLVYYPLIKTGDYDVLKPQLEFYRRILKTAELATEHYWHHSGARFPEQIDNYGLSNPAEYGWGQRSGLNPGVDDNPWLEYHWDTALEFCLMMLQEEEYGGVDISVYIPFIISCTDFFDEHYRYLAHLRGSETLDEDGHIILYPGSGAETFKMAYNPTSTITGLRTILKKTLALPDSYLREEQRKHLDSVLHRLPPISFREQQGHPTIAPARAWERIQNIESPQLYPVYPWGIYGIGRPGLDTALNTWNYDQNVIEFRSYVGWKQDNIWAARLGLTDEAARLTFLKLKNSGRRFPAFWGPGFDWNPDHNWGGSGMIGLQEMLVQAVEEKIYLFPAWPKELDVYFRLHAPGQTTVECRLEQGRITSLQVIPASRKKDIVWPGWVETGL